MKVFEVKYSGLTYVAATSQKEALTVFRDYITSIVNQHENLKLREILDLNEISDQWNSTDIPWSVNNDMTLEEILTPLDLDLVIEQLTKLPKTKRRALIRKLSKDL